MPTWGVAAEPISGRMVCQSPSEAWGPVKLQIPESSHLPAPMPIVVQDPLARKLNRRTLVPRHFIVSQLVQHSSCDD